MLRDYRPPLTLRSTKNIFPHTNYAEGIREVITPSVHPAARCTDIDNEYRLLRTPRGGWSKKYLRISIFLLDVMLSREIDERIARIFPCNSRRASPLDYTGQQLLCVRDKSHQFLLISTRCIQISKYNVPLLTPLEMHMTVEIFIYFSSKLILFLRLANLCRNMPMFYCPVRGSLLRIK